MRELNLSVNLSNVLFIRALEIWKKRKQNKRNIITMWTTSTEQVWNDCKFE